MKRDDCIYVAGHRGLVGSAVTRRLRAGGYENLLLRTREQVDLTDSAATQRLFESERPKHVVLAAAKVGGILANSSFPAEFIRENLAIALNVIEAARQIGVERLLFLGSSCIYPKHAPQPMKEAHLLTGPLEPTNEWYAVAKIAGLKLCQAYNHQYGTRWITAMPTNLYGPGDNFDLDTSHVLPALIRKCHEAKASGEREVQVWGTGAPRREFLHVEDLADACVFLMERDDAPEVVNIGVGRDISIGELVQLVSEVVGFDGDVVYDRSKPDGTPRKLLDVSGLEQMGWRARISLRQGIGQTYQRYRDNMPAASLSAATTNNGS